MLRAGKGAVECDVLDGAQEEGEEQCHNHGEDAEQPEVCAVDGQDAAEEEGGQVGHESGGEEAADDAHAHTQGPEHGDGRVFAHIFLAGNPLYAEGTEDGEYHGRENRIDAREYTDADASERGMGDTAADEYQSAGNDVGSDKSAQDACQEGSYQCILEKCILQYIHLISLNCKILA